MDSELLWRRQCGERLERAIEALGLTKAEAARRMGIDQSKLGHWVAGRFRPDLYTLSKFCLDYGITFDWIFLGKLGGLPHALIRPIETPPDSGVRRPGRPRKPR